MTIVSQNELESLDGFQVDQDQFWIDYNLGCDIADAFSDALKEACESDDRLLVCEIVWFMLLANELPLPSRTSTCRCDPNQVRPWIRSLSFEARRGDRQNLYMVLAYIARAAGSYQSDIRPSKN